MNRESLPYFDEIEAFVLWAWSAAEQWLTSPAAWSQFTLLLVAYLAARYLRQKISPVLQSLLTPAEAREDVLAQGFRFVLSFLPLLLPLLAYGFTALGEQIVRGAFPGSGEVIAFGKRVFLFIAARILVRDVIKDPFLKLLGKFFLVPVAGLHALGFCRSQPSFWRRQLSRWAICPLIFFGLFSSLSSVG